VGGAECRVRDFGWAMIEALEKLGAVYKSIPGGLELLNWFEQIPTFHDGEVVSLHLNRRATSFLKIHGWVGDGKTDAKGYFNLLQRAVVTFEMDTIVYLKLDGFSQQNVIGELDIRRAPKDPKLAPFYDFAATDDDFELHLDPCYGMDGIIRCRSVRISYQPGEPEDKYRSK
jgi:Immunity protein 50